MRFEQLNPFIWGATHTDEEIDKINKNFDAFRKEYNVIGQYNGCVSFYNSGYLNRYTFVNLKTGRYKEFDNITLPKSIFGTDPECTVSKLWYFDHRELFKTVDKKYIYVSHPYYDFDFKSMDQRQLNAYNDFLAFMDSFGYKVTIWDSAKDWYNPGSTSTIIVTLKN